MLDTHDSSRTWESERPDSEYSAEVKTRVGDGDYRTRDFLACLHRGNWTIDFHAIPFIKGGGNESRNTYSSFLRNLPADCVNTGNSGRNRESKRPNQAHEAEVCKNADSGNRRACDFDLHFRIYSIALVITGITGGMAVTELAEIFFDFVEEQIW